MSQNAIQFLTAQKEPSRCSRCGGPMVAEYYHSGIGTLPVSRCLLCGDVIDPIILSNRTKQSLGTDRVRKGKYSR